MGQIPVEQAVFASHNNSRIRGYQLIARSPGIDEVVAQQLVRWSPSHDGLPAVLGPATGLSFFPVDRSRVAVGRTTEGGPEYSGRGGRQAFTSFLVTTREHLAGFGNNAWAFTLRARSQGWLRFRNLLPDALPPLVMNETWEFGQMSVNTPVDQEDQQELVAEAVDYLRAGNRVAVLETQHPESVLRQILTQIEFDQRAGISFAIGLQPSSQRPFQLQFPADSDVGTRSDLSRDGVKLLRPRTAVQSRSTWDRYE